KKTGSRYRLCGEAARRKGLRFRTGERGRAHGDVSRDTNMTIKAIRFYENGGPEVLRWEEIELPLPSPAEARIRHTAIALNFSDVNVRRGGFYLARPLRFPVIPGNEAAGVVESIGSGTTE